MHTYCAICASRERDWFAHDGGATVAAGNDSEVVAAWNGLDDRVGLVILSKAAADALGPRVDERAQTLTVVMP